MTPPELVRLRDELAAVAMGALLTRGDPGHSAATGPARRLTAEQAYLMADEMLRQRQLPIIDNSLEVRHEPDPRSDTFIDLDKLRARGL